MAQGSSNPTTDIKKVAGTAVDTNTGNASAGTQRVVLASNQPVIPVSDNGGSITVDGTFWQATQPVSGPLTDTQLRASAVPVSIASVPSHAVTNAGTFAVQVDGAALTALQLLDNAVATDGSAAVTGMFQVGGTDGTNAQILSTNTSGHVNIADGGNSITVDGTLASTQSGTWTVQPGNTANTTPWLVKPAESLGTATALGALNAEIVQALNGNLGAGATITATATPVGVTLTPYASYDGGTNWTVTQFFNSVNGDVVPTLTSFTVGEAYSLSAGDGATHVKVRATGWTSGSVTVRLSASNSQGLVNLKATATHDDPVGSFIIQNGAYASSTAPSAVANGDAVRLWATTSGALNIADGGGNISIDDGGNSITVDGTVTANAGTGNFTVTQATAANLNATVTGTVELGATSLAALENISVTVPGTVDLGTVSLTALETITVTSGTPNNFQSKAYGAVTTAAPAYTNATDNALSLTTSGSLRTAVSEALPAGTNNIGDVDVLSVIPGTGATNLGKAVDSASAATDTGVASLAIRTDTLATITPAVSDYTQLRVNSVGRLWASATIDAALPAGTNAIGSITNTSFAATQSGTWTVQPGNTQNTTPWLVTSGATLGTPFISSIAQGATAGTVPSGLYYFRVVAVDAFGGTTLPSSESSVTVTGPTSINLQVQATNIPGIDHYRAYFTTTSGNYTSGNYIRFESYYTTITSLSGTASATLPTANTTYDSRNKELASSNDPNNSTVINLAGNAVFTGNTTDISEFSQISLSVYSSHASATDGLSYQFSQDGTNWDQVNTASVLATTELSIILASRLRYFRLVYTNGATTTTTLRIQTRLWRTSSPSTIKELALATKEQDLVTQTRSVLTGRNVPAGTTFNDVVVKPASTAAAATDTALVVAVRDSVPVTGTFYQATQPVSLASVPSHPVTNAGTFAVQVTSAPTTAVTGTFWQATQPVSGTVTVNPLPTGTNSIGKLAANSGVDIGDVDVLSIVPGTAATNLGKAVDGVAGATDTGVMALAVRDDALATLTPIDGDYTQLRVTSQGRLWASATIDAALPAGTNAIGSITNTTFSVTNAVATNLKVEAQQVQGSAATRWYTQISDGTNSPAIKAASTAAATADPAMVVSFAAANSATKISDGTTTATVKTAITEPAFGLDTALTVQTRDPVRIRPSETYRDPVDKMRVSMGQSLIDTDFEYGIQPTKWESLTLLNNRATAFYDVTQVVPGVINTTTVSVGNITASGKTVTVTGNNFNGAFVVGQPFFITGTLDTANADGWWIVDSVVSNTLTFLVNNAPAASLYDATKTYIYPGTFFTGSSIALPSNTTIAATVATADTVGNFTCGATATLAVGNPVYVTGTNSGAGSISGYASGNVYYIIATNGSTTFQLSATPGGAGVTTVAGSLTGLSFSMNAITVTGTTVIVRTLADHGLRVNNGIYMKGTTGVTGGPVNGTWNIATTPLNNVFTYTTNATATGAITASAGVSATLYPRQPGYIEHRPYDGGVQFSNETAYHGYSDIRQTRRYFRYQSGKGIQFSTGTIMKPPFYVDQLTSSGTTVTVTTKYPHGLLVGSTVIVSGATPAAYNGTFTVTASTPLTITYTAGSAPGTSPATGFPINVSPGTWYGGSNRVGMFDQQNGFFFEFDGQTLYAVIRKSTDQISGKVGVTLGSQIVTGTNTFFSSQLKPGDQVVIRGMAYLVQNIQSNTSMTVYPEYRGVTTSNCICTKTVEIRTSQSGWNIDTVNSGTRSLTNPNGFQLDLTKMQMFYADYSWYGAGAVRFGFKDQRGEVIFCHRVVNSNVNYEAYMRSGNLPARYETNTLPARTHLTATLAAATTTGGTITVDATTLFPSSGTVILTQSTATGAYSEYITYSAKTATTFTITARAQTGGVGTAQTFTYSATAPIKVELYAPQAAQTLSHWGSSVIMDGGYDDDKSLVFNTGMTTPMVTATAGTRYPLMSLRLAPTVDNGITGLLGAREIINRMQLALRSIGTYTTNVAFRIEILLNARVSGGTFAPVGGSSLSQICYHTNTQTVAGGESMFAFYATANDTNSMDLEQVRDLGTSILGGGTTLSFPTGNNEKYPDGPDIVTVIAIPLTSNASSSIVARLNWTEAQA